MPDQTTMRLGTLVRFAHERVGGPVHKVVSVMSDGMVEVHDMVGYFAHHLFAVADDIGGIPQPRRNADGTPCGECHIQPGETCDICGASKAPEDQAR